MAQARLSHSRISAIREAKRVLDDDESGSEDGVRVTSPAPAADSRRLSEQMKAGHARLTLREIRASPLKGKKGPSLSSKVPHPLC
jgi:hypothetical protein